MGDDHYISLSIWNVDTLEEFVTVLARRQHWDVAWRRTQAGNEQVHVREPEHVEIDVLEPPGDPRLVTMTIEGTAGQAEVAARAVHDVLLALELDHQLELYSRQSDEAVPRLVLRR